MEKRQPTESELDAMMTDWLAGSRDSGTAVHRGMEGAGNGQGTQGCGYFLKGDSVLSARDMLMFLKKARSIAQTAVNATSSRPVRVRLGTDTSMTDGRTITVATDFFDDDDGMTPDGKIDLLSGYSIHEALHINHTDTGAGTGWLMNMPPHKRRFCRNIQNIIEDERIEYMLSEPLACGGDGKPGYTHYLAACKKHSFGKVRDLTGMKTTPAMFMNLLLLAVRYPAGLDRRLVRDNYHLLAGAREILTPFPRTQQQVFAASERIYDMLKEHMAEEEEKRRQQQKQEQQKQQKKEQQGNGQDRKGSVTDEYRRGWLRAIAEYEAGNTAGLKREQEQKSTQQS